MEASPRNAALLKASISANRFDRAQVIHAGVSDRPGTLIFEAAGLYGRVSPDGERSPHAVEVAAITVDSLLEGLDAARPDFIKMDVEGSEVAALRGMARVASGADAPPIFYESNAHTLHFFGQTPRKRKATAEALGYRNYWVDGNRLVPVSAADLQPETVVDYLAMKRIPEALRPRVIAQGRPRAELLAASLAMCDSPEVDHRAAIARALADAPAGIASHPRIVAAVRKLRSDPSGDVRGAAASIVPRSWLGRIAQRLDRSA